MRVEEEEVARLVSSITPPPRLPPLHHICCITLPLTLPVFPSLSSPFVSSSSSSQYIAVFICVSSISIFFTIRLCIHIFQFMFLIHICFSSCRPRYPHPLFLYPSCHPCLHAHMSSLYFSDTSMFSPSFLFVLYNYLHSFPSYSLCPRSLLLSFGSFPSCDRPHPSPAATPFPKKWFGLESYQLSKRISSHFQRNS